MTGAATVSAAAPATESKQRLTVRVRRGLAWFISRETTARARELCSPAVQDQLPREERFGAELVADILATCNWIEQEAAAKGGVA